MNALGQFRKADYWRIRWSLVYLLSSLLLMAGIFIGLNKLDTTATVQLRSALDQLSEARGSTLKIAEEQAMIEEYVSRYRQIAAEGSVQDEDRLQFLESLARARAEYSLFPIQINMEGQNLLTLPYTSPATGAEGPVTLRASAVEISLPLLHEDDLARLLGSLLNSPGLLQPRECSLTVGNQNSTNYIYLAQHFNATCNLLWYTFSLQADAAVEPSL